jgi:hypothetical protein
MERRKFPRSCVRATLACRMAPQDDAKMREMTRWVPRPKQGKVKTCVSSQ